MTVRRGAVLLAALAVTAACGLAPDSDPDTILGSGVIRTFSRDVGAFDSVEFASEGRVLITQTDAESLTITADDNLVAYLETTVVGSTLLIRTMDDTDIDASDTMVFRIGTSDLREITVSGVAEVEADGMAAPVLRLELSGVGGFDLRNVAVERLDVSASGVGKIVVAGTATTAAASLSGPADYLAGDLRTSSTSVDLSGTGSAAVWAVDTLVVDVSGSGAVRYYGSPVVSSTITGTGGLEALGDR